MRNCKFFSSISFRSAIDICQCPTFSSNNNPRKQAWQGKILIFTRKCVFKRCMFHCYVSFQGEIAGFFFGPNPIFQQFPSLENIKHHWNPRLQDISPWTGYKWSYGTPIHRQKWMDLLGLLHPEISGLMGPSCGSRDPMPRGRSCVFKHHYKVELSITREHETSFTSFL